jgi:hypothetical protein
MRKTQSITASGHPLIEWGGHDAWKTRRLGDLLVSLEWAVLPESRTAQRVALIGRPREGRVVQLSDATQGNWHPRCYREADRPYMLEFNPDGTPTGRPTRDMIWDAGQSIQLLGYGPDDRTAIRHYIDALLNAMIDMVRMPSAPPKVRRRLVGGDSTTFEVTANRGGIITEAAV